MKREGERGVEQSMGVLADWEEDDADGMRLAIGIWEVRGGWDFCGLGASVVGAGGRVRWGGLSRRGGLGGHSEGLCCGLGEWEA